MLRLHVGPSSIVRLLLARALVRHQVTGPAATTTQGATDQPPKAATPSHKRAGDTVARRRDHPRLKGPPMAPISPASAYVKILYTTGLTGSLEVRELIEQHDLKPLAVTPEYTADVLPANIHYVEFASTDEASKLIALGNSKKLSLGVRTLYTFPVTKSVVAQRTKLFRQLIGERAGRAVIVRSVPEHYAQVTRVLDFFCDYDVDPSVHVTFSHEPKRHRSMDNFVVTMRSKHEAVRAVRDLHGRYVGPDYTLDVLHVPSC